MEKWWRVWQEGLIRQKENDNSAPLGDDGAGRQENGGQWLRRNAVA